MLYTKQAYQFSPSSMGQGFSFLLATCQLSTFLPSFLIVTYHTMYIICGTSRCNLICVRYAHVTPENAGYDKTHRLYMYPSSSTIKKCIYVKVQGMLDRRGMSRSNFHHPQPLKDKRSKFWQACMVYKFWRENRGSWVSE